MIRRLLAIVVASIWVATCLVSPAVAENAMGYRLLSTQEAGGLPRNHGSLGMDVERANEITDSGMTFDIMRVKQVRRGSAAERAGFHAGDQLIAVDGYVFPTIATFAAYVGSIEPGTRIAVDYMPAGGGPGQAQRIGVTIGSPAQPAPISAPAPAGMSTGTKVAIGVGAAALLGCYEMGCFSHRGPAPQQR